MKIPKTCLCNHHVEQHGDYCRIGLFLISYGTTITCLDCQKSYVYRSLKFNKHPIKYLKGQYKKRLYQDELPF